MACASVRVYVQYSIQKYIGCLSVLFNWKVRLLQEKQLQMRKSGNVAARTLHDKMADRMIIVRPVIFLRDKA